MATSDKSGSQIVRAVMAKPVDPLASVAVSTTTVLVIFGIHTRLGISDADLLKVLLALAAIATVARSWWEGRRVP